MPVGLPQIVWAFGQWDIAFRVTSRDRVGYLAGNNLRFRATDAGCGCGGVAAGARAKFDRSLLAPRPCPNSPIAGAHQGLQVPAFEYSDGALARCSKTKSYVHGLRVR